MLVAGIVVVLVVVVGLGFTLFGNSGLLRSDDGDSVTIGTTEASQDYWPIFVRKAKDRGVTIKTVNFSDGNQVNPALAQKQVDLNLFQHLQFLADYNVSTGNHLVPVGSTYIVPLAVYSKRHHSIQDIPDGGTVAIPNDATNQARALLVLKAAGLVDLRGGGNIKSTPADVLSGSRVNVVPVAAQQTVASLPSVDAAVINNNFAQDAGLDPASAIYQDDPKSAAAEPYINIIVARPDDADNAAFGKVVEAFHDPEVTAALVKQSKNTAVIVSRPRADLEQILDRLEGQLR
ncbi:MetQ/NlpA family ABC transporter substrate-binding protein [Gordonia sp. DT30]|uniref:MetQ/NlpA family ABC transporter substrate-binding protein n=1 Tax=unclassified Gordonia (in: high G+C Gram-positive bacteria) TaxID=2657482 RepID=UPI003CF4D7DF